MKLRETFWNLVRFKVGSGSEVCFWADRWGGEVSLNMTFKSLSLLAVDPRASVANFFDIGENVWLPKFRRDLNDW